MRAALAVEEETRRKVEAASVRTLQELRAQEDARWEVERKLQAEVVRSTELEQLAKRTEAEAREKVSDAEAREAKATAAAADAGRKYVESEKMRVALQGRVDALDRVKTQLEQQLNLEREACAVELGLRQKAEVAVAEATRAQANAQQQAAEATQAAEVARASLEMTSKELASAEERLRVANDSSLDQQMATSAAEEVGRLDGPNR